MSFGSDCKAFPPKANTIFIKAPPKNNMFNTLNLITYISLCKFMIHYKFNKNIITSLNLCKYINIFNIRNTFAKLIKIITN
ncbi:hypothetical protein CBB2_3432 [Clostridium botulinum]|nr:hypothetical protein CBB2_3432 [Clostridium botulinum]